MDLVAELALDQVTSFLSMVAGEFYASELAIRDAIKRKSCFNLIHFESSFKVDIFISRERTFDMDSFERAIEGEIGFETKLLVPFASAEDIIISKLEWFRWEMKRPNANGTTSVASTGYLVSRLI